MRRDLTGIPQNSRGFNLDHRTWLTMQTIPTISVTKNRVNWWRRRRRYQPIIYNVLAVGIHAINFSLLMEHYMLLMLKLLFITNKFIRTDEKLKLKISLRWSILPCYTSHLKYVFRLEETKFTHSLRKRQLELSICT